MAWDQRTASSTPAWLTSLHLCSRTGTGHPQTSQQASSGHLSSPVSQCVVCFLNLYREYINDKCNFRVFVMI